MNYHDYLARRWFFKECGVGLGTIALHALLHDRAGAASHGNAPAAAADPMAPRRPHFPASAGHACKTSRTETVHAACKTIQKRTL